MAADHKPLAERFDAYTVRHPDAPVMRALLRLPIVFWRLGLGPMLGSVEVSGGHLVLLTTVGRSSGVPRHAPVVTHTVAGRTYLWCPYGGGAQWYRNVQVNPVVTVQSQHDSLAMRAVAVEDVDEAIKVAAALRSFDVTFFHSYLDAQGIADSHTDLTANAQRLHIRRLDPTGEPGPPGLRADLVGLWPALAGIALFGWVISMRRSRLAAMEGATRQQPSGPHRGRGSHDHTRHRHTGCSPARTCRAVSDRLRGA